MRVAFDHPEAPGALRRLVRLVANAVRRVLRRPIYDWAHCFAMERGDQCLTCHGPVLRRQWCPGPPRLVMVRGGTFMTESSAVAQGIELATQEELQAYMRQQDEMFREHRRGYA